MKKKKKIQTSLWTRDFALLIIISMFSFCSISVIGSILSLYIVWDFQGTPTEVGLVTSLMALSTFLFRPFTGYIVDRMGRKWAMIISLAVTAVINFCLLLPMNLVGLGVLRFLSGFPFALNSTSLSTLTSDLVPEERRADGFSISSSIVTFFSQVFAPIASLWILGDNNFDLIFIISVVLALSGFFLIFLMRFEDIKDRNLSFSRNSLFEKRSLWLSLVMSLTFLGWPGLLTYGPLYAEEIGLGSAVIFLFAFGIGLFQSRMIGNLILDLRKPQRAGMLSLFSLLVGFVITGYFPPGWNFILGGALIGMGYGLSFAIFPAMAVNLVEKTRRGVCNATLTFGQDVGAFFGSYVFGWTAQAFGNYSSSYSLIGFIMAVPVLFFLFFALPDYRKNKKDLKIEKGEEIIFHP